ncbi:hypothetical protein HMI56_004644 [Coelomomyces lativittatus]|nr:hypothetical protein HMI56_004644 [Coelomomyces lativittatus]
MQGEQDANQKEIKDNIVVQEEVEDPKQKNPIRGCNTKTTDKPLTSPCCRIPNNSGNSKKPLTEEAILGSGGQKTCGSSKNQNLGQETQNVEKVSELMDDIEFSRASKKGNTVSLMIFTLVLAMNVL